MSGPFRRISWPAWLIVLTVTSLLVLPTTSEAGFGDDPARHTQFSARIVPATGEHPPRLVISVTLDDHWHIYSMRKYEKGESAPQATVISLDESSAVEFAGPFEPTQAPLVRPPGETGFDVPTEEFYDSFMWVAPLSVPEGTDLETVTLSGTITGQECDPHSCNPFTNRFEAELDRQLAVPATVKVASLVAASSGGSGLWAALGLAFLGGIVLNVMPCVLPVIGLKVMAFIEQGGQSRSRIFLLNFWYSLGVIAVWMALAVLATIFQIGLGELFQTPEFSIVMASVIFAMGLSFLGVWEIPIPGFIGTQNVTKLGEREGYEGAFAKGTITTVLATPCLGPFMGGLFISLLDRPAFEIYAIFFAIGLGMASPYLVLGMVPQAMRFLPKPGAWMNTFKEIMGFFLIGTTVYLMTIPQTYLLVPTLVLLIGLGVVCWWIGRVPSTADPSRRWRALGEAMLAGVLIGVTAFYVIAPEMRSRMKFDNWEYFDYEIERMVADGELKVDGELPVFNRPWQPYTTRKFKWLVENNKPVLIDFTADWCQTCKWNEKFVLKTRATRELLEEHDVYTLVADLTHKDVGREGAAKLKELRADGIPLIAIYAPGEVDQPTLIPGTFTRADLAAEIRRKIPKTVVVDDATRDDRQTTREASREEAGGRESAGLRAR
ncbi:MAG: hypothetical protein DWQ42_00900 [Planctomycetota bacterium]|nr:MAG: hypothetical protein DWQ42_00900 [Planctomycetota bacterium]REK43566.1 MAG: hypothetical protein DWQ46_10785 [Planctomycetota bacterium]